LSGTLEVLKDEDGPEYKFAEKALFQRHRSMKSWPEDHDWIIFTIRLQDVWLIDFFGGASILDIVKYKAVELMPLKEED
jgi:hypothetical protein